ncbi:MAG: polyphosphate kinase 1, partial [Fibrobacterota bacterium]
RISLDFLKKELGVMPNLIFPVEGMLDYTVLMSVASEPGNDNLKYTFSKPVRPAEMPVSESVFKSLLSSSFLFYHPYESFDPVLRFIDESARDPDVLAIKQTLYRTSSGSPVIKALIKAAESGKAVTAVVELKARFDEARNIEWAKALEDSGVQVVYGIKGLKTHSKIYLVIRKETGGIRKYCHFGTGNYNEKTASLYTDISYLTSDENLCNDASLFFNVITGYSQPTDYNKIAAAPLGLRDALSYYINSEIKRKKSGQKAEIKIKINSLADTNLINELYRASEAGVKIQLNVRGICMLRPGVKGMSENIRVVSIIDRYLEHARIFYFHHGGEKKIFISSADWMTRNLDKRIELMVPVEPKELKKKLEYILNTHLFENTNGWEMNGDGSYSRIIPEQGKEVRSQEIFQEYASSLLQKANKKKKVTFEPFKSAGKH